VTVVETMGARTAPHIALSMPPVKPDDDTISAAVEYAAAGWYVLPVRRGAGKHPGSVVGGGWQHQSSRNPAPSRLGSLAPITRSPCTSDGPALSRSTLTTPPRFPKSWRSSSVSGACRSSPPATMFRDAATTFSVCLAAGRSATPAAVQPAVGATFAGTTGSSSRLRRAPAAGRRRSVRVAADRAGAGAAGLDRELLPDATDTVNVATDREVADFLAEHTTGDRLDELVGALLRGWRKAVDSGESCHGATVRTVVGAMKEVRAGQYPAEDAAAWLRQEFVAVMTAPRPTHGGTRPRVLPKSAATAEFDGILAWSVGQAKGADLTAVLARVNEKMPTLGELDVPARVEPARERHGRQLRFAERLAARHGDRLLNVHGIGWHVWDGARWRGPPGCAPLNSASHTPAPWCRSAAKVQAGNEPAGATRGRG
jgi:hypothetical protein